MSMTGTVTKFATTKNGKPTIYIDQKMYFVGRCDVSGVSVGDHLSFEAHAFSDDGKLWGLDKWAKVPNGNGVSGPNLGQPIQPYERAAPALDEPTLRFISNCVGSAITAGTIKEPEAIEKWVSAARNALKAQS